MAMTRRFPFSVMLTIGLCCGAAAANSVEAVVHHTTSGLDFGKVLGAPYDADGDGTDDLVVFVPDAGTMQVRDGDDPTIVLFTLSPTVSGGTLTALDWGDDHDGDGVDDPFVGEEGGSSVRGRVHRVSGDDGSILWTVTGAANGDGFSRALASCGDVDGDGEEDVLVGAPDADVGGTDTGSAFVLSGYDGSEIHVAHGSAAGDSMGSSVDALNSREVGSDVDPGLIVDMTMPGGTRRGRMQVRRRSDFSVVITVDGVANGDSLGIVGLIIEDVDGDGTHDIAVSGEPLDSNGVPDEPGYVLVISGDDGSLIRRIDGSTTGTHFGASLARAGDVDGDGKYELLIGESGHDGNGTDAGAVHCVHLDDGTEHDVAFGPAADARFGEALADLGDIDGDLYREFVVGAPGDDTLGAAYGSISVMAFDRWKNLANALAGTYGDPKIVGQGSVEAGETIDVELTNALESAPVVLVMGYDLALDSEHSVLVPVQVTTVTGTTDSSGDLTIPFTVPTGLAAGTLLHFQVYVDDVQGPDGTARSNVLRARVD